LPAGASPAESPVLGARKPLWALMGKAASSPPGASAPEAGSPPEVIEGESRPGADEPGSATAAGNSATDMPARDAASPTPVRKGLWGVMQTMPPVLAPPPTTSEIRNPRSEMAHPDVAAPLALDSFADARPPDAALADVIGIPPVETESL